MKQVLIDKILKGKTSKFVQNTFTEDFQTPKQWYSYLTTRFGKEGVADIGRILNKKPVIKKTGLLGGYQDPWHAEAFQALYIACWIYQPLEKGSFMIRLNPDQVENAQRSADELTWRKSSHLKATSRSARGGAGTYSGSGKGFSFIKGYDELLVIVQDNYLFLKMEGHSAAHVGHLASWVVKEFTGAGEVSNQYLNTLGSSDKSELYGFLGRGAENYSKPYEKLLEKIGVFNLEKGGYTHIKTASIKTVVKNQTLLGSQGTMVSLKDTFTALAIEFFRKTTQPEQKVKDFLIKHGFNGSILNCNVDAAIIELTSSATTSHQRELKLLLEAAKGDILRIAKAGKEAARQSTSLGNEDDGFNQIFHELRVEPQVINESLKDFLTQMSASKLTVESM